MFSSLWMLDTCCAMVYILQQLAFSLFLRFIPVDTDTLVHSSWCSEPFMGYRKSKNQMPQGDGAGTGVAQCPRRASWVGFSKHIHVPWSDGGEKPLFSCVLFKFHAVLSTNRTPSEALSSGTRAGRVGSGSEPSISLHLAVPSPSHTFWTATLKELLKSGGACSPNG